MAEVADSRNDDEQAAAAAGAAPPADRPDADAASLHTTAEILDRVVEAMRCPTCQGTMHRSASALQCAQGHGLPLIGGYVDASGGATPDLATKQTFESFGYEWTTFSSIREEDAKYAEHYLRDLDLESLEGRLGLDAGCGRARYSRFLAPHLGALVALDGSDAVSSAAQNLGDMPNTMVVRSDLRDAPFAPESFGFIASLGVLHHLVDPRAGFERLVRLLQPGGIMLLYLYSRPEHMDVRGFGLAAATAFRRLTVRMPHRLLRALSTPIAYLLYATVVMAGKLGDRLKIEPLSSLPMATYRDKPVRSLVLDTFDRLSAPVEYRYVWSELAPWFESVGMVVDAHRDDSGWFVVAHRPA